MTAAISMRPVMGTSGSQREESSAVEVIDTMDTMDLAMTCSYPKSFDPLGDHSIHDVGVVDCELTWAETSSSTVSTQQHPHTQQQYPQQQQQQEQPHEMPRDDNKRSARKQVRFAVDDETGSVLKSYYPAAQPVTIDERDAVWWKPVEFKLFRRFSKKMATTAQQSDFLPLFTALYTACAAADLDSLKVQFLSISDTPARGLEVVIFANLLQDRKSHIQGVIRTQSKLPATMPSEKRAEVLAATSQYLSKQARLLARVLALGDAHVARDCYQQPWIKAQPASPSTASSCLSQTPAQSQLARTITP